jgi:hypothetical protein
VGTEPGAGPGRGSLGVGSVPGAAGQGWREESVPGAGGREQQQGRAAVKKRMSVNVHRVQGVVRPVICV